MCIIYQAGFSLDDRIPLTVQKEKLNLLKIQRIMKIESAIIIIVVVLAVAEETGGTVTVDGSYV